MHHQTLKKYVAAYGELILSNIEEAKTQLAAEGLSPEDIEEVIAKANDSSEGSTAPTAPAAPAKNAKKSTLSTYEKCKIEVLANGNFEKVKVIKTVSISERQAELLNDQTRNSKIHYYLVEG